jgi:hypothetical protein
MAALWYAQGVANGEAALAGSVSSIRANPFFSVFDFSSEELTSAIKESVVGRQEEFHRELDSMVDARIKTLYVRQWRASLSWVRRTFTNVERDERMLRTRMGLSDIGPLPDPLAPPGEVAGPDSDTDTGAGRGPATTPDVPDATKASETAGEFSPAEGPLAQPAETASRSVTPSAEAAGTPISDESNSSGGPLPTTSGPLPEGQKEDEGVDGR